MPRGVNTFAIHCMCWWAGLWAALSSWWRWLMKPKQGLGQALYVCLTRDTGELCTRVHTHTHLKGQRSFWHLLNISVTLNGHWGTMRNDRLHYVFVRFSCLGWNLTKVLRFFCWIWQTIPSVGNLSFSMSYNLRLTEKEGKLFGIQRRQSKQHESSCDVKLVML